MFRMVGNFQEVNMHVINGACPVHARIRNLPIAESERPSEIHLKRVEGEVVGVWLSLLDIVVSYNDAKLQGWYSGNDNPTNQAMKRLVSAVQQP